MFQHTHRNSAFTLIELLVVIVIIGILATISVSTFSGFFEKARLAKAQAAYTQLRNIFLHQGALLETDNTFTLWYSFDSETSINQTNPYLIDNSGNNKNSYYSTGSGSFSQSEDTPFSTGYSLQTSKIVGIAPSIHDGPTDKITIAAWVKFKNDDISWQRPISIANSSGFQHFGVNKKLRFYINNNEDYIDSLIKIEKDRWYYVVGSYGNKTMRFWIDGDLVGIKENVIQTRPFKGGGYPLWIGQSFNGWIDEIMIFPYVFNGIKF